MNYECDDCGRTLGGRVEFYRPATPEEVATPIPRGQLGVYLHPSQKPLCKPCWEKACEAR
jgi:hypothetical protein